MTFTNAIKTCLRKYITFSGRASRPEYWYFFLFALILGFVASAIDWWFFTTVVTLETDSTSLIKATSDTPIQGLLGLLIFLPYMAVAWRRMHDTGRSGIYALLPMLMSLAAFLVMFFGIGLADQFSHNRSLDVFLTRTTLFILIPTIIVLFVSPLLVFWWLSRPSQPGVNKYGPNPHEVSS